MSRASGAAIIEAWRRKAYDNREDDVAKTLICRTLEMLEVIERGYDAEIEFKLANMRNERATALKFDKRMDQPHRKMLYTLSESVERLCELMLAQQKVAEVAIAEAREERARRQAEMPDEEQLELKYDPLGEPVDMADALGLADPIGPIDPPRITRSITPQKSEDPDLPEWFQAAAQAPQAPAVPANPADLSLKRITTNEFNVDVGVRQQSGGGRDARGGARVRQESQSGGARRGAASAVNEGVVKEEKEDPLMPTRSAVPPILDDFKLEDTDLKDEPMDHDLEDENIGSNPLPGPSHTNNMLINQMMMRRGEIPRVRSAHEPASRRGSIRRRREGSATESNLSCHKCTVQGMGVKEWFDHLRNVHNSSAAKEFLALSCECGDLTSTKYADFTLHKYSCNKTHYKIVKATWTS